jgi:Na+-driven multidrug efflux pump
MIPVGIAIATNVLVGNNIGAHNIKAAKYYAK